MVQAQPQYLEFEDYLEWHPEDGRIFELYDGVPIEMNPNGPHEQVSGFLTVEIGFEIRRCSLPYFIPKTATLKPLTQRQGYKPDVIVLDETAIAQDPLWATRSTVGQRTSVKLVVEVISTNWRIDYGIKLNDYEEMGIPEYWIVDYIPLGASRYVGATKVPVVSVYHLVDSEYQLTQFRDIERIHSPLFPDLTLTANQIFSKAELLD
jgi:Uma2 family endonuclease